MEFKRAESAGKGVFLGRVVILSFYRRLLKFILFRNLISVEEALGRTSLLGSYNYTFLIREDIIEL